MKHIAVIMGGYSDEAEVSFKSGAVVVEALENTEFRPYPIHIYKDRWVYKSPSGEEFEVDKNDFSVTYHQQKITFDAVFNAIHGSPGEDGLLQAYFQMTGIPMTGSGMYASAITFNKRDMLSILKPFGIQSAKSYFINQGEVIDSKSIVEKVGLPCFVKANHSGSSFGVYKVKEESELATTIHKAFEIDSEVLIEEFLDGTEVSVGVITYQKEIKVLPITEIVSENEFFDYEAKYLGKSQEITPARISQELTQQIQSLAERIYRVLNLKGFSRGEFIIVDNQPYLLEFNTSPGLSKASILPQQAEKAGISIIELFTNALREIL